MSGRCDASPPGANPVLSVGKQVPSFGATTLEGVRDFNLLWAGQTVSMFGSVVSRLAIPTTAIFVLHATAFVVGALTAAEYLAFPLLGVIAGVFVDRWPRRRVLIGGDVVRALALGSIPLAAVLGAISLLQLYLVALVVGVATVFFDVAY